jgi:CubicO group peptidase (beta-lactamase class C family)
MRRTRLGFAATLLAAGHCTPALASTAQPADYSGLAQLVDAAVAEKELPSVVIAVFNEDHILWSHVAGHSDLASKTAPTLRTRYRLGSMAKAVTSTVLAIAEQQRLICFELPVEVRTADGFRRVPLRELVNMQAGLAQAVCYSGITGDPDGDCDRSFDRRFGVAITEGKDRYSYSNMGPQLAANALARRLNQPFAKVAANLLFSPARMIDMTFDHERSVGGQATSYDRDGKPYRHDFRILPAAGAGLEGSAEDLVRLGQLHLTGRAADGRQLLLGETLAQLHSAPNDGFYGYGWGRIGAGKPTEVLISDGQVNGGQGMLLINPARNVGAVVIANAAHDKVSEFALKAIDLVSPGTSAMFAADVEKAQSHHESKVATYIPPKDFDGTGFLSFGSDRIPITASASEDRLTVMIVGKASEQAQSEVDEGFRGWAIPCPVQLSACDSPGAKAKLWLSRDSGGLSGQLQVTSLNGQLPYPVRLRLR